MNKVILSGNLTKEVEVRYTQNGKAVAKVGLAVTRNFKNADVCGFEILSNGSAFVTACKRNRKIYRGESGRRYAS